MRASILNTAWTHVSRKLVWPTLIFPCIHPPTAIGAVSVEFDQTAEAVAGLKTRESKVATTSSLRTLSLSPRRSTSNFSYIQLGGSERTGKMTQLPLQHPLDHEDYRSDGARRVTG